MLSAMGEWMPSQNIRWLEWMLSVKRKERVIVRDEILYHFTAGEIEL